VHTLDELTDEGLSRAMVAYRRDVEDGVRVEGSRRALARSREIQLARFRLRMRYGAEERGTDSYDRWYRFDEAPSYRLSAALDLHRCRAGQSHVLAWPA
jgi:hypothetical protein